MNRAIDLENNQTIYAHKLQEIENVHLKKFKCIGSNCGILVVPSSFRKHNKQGPHFRKLKGHEHIESCDFASNNTIIGKGIEGKRISGQEMRKIGFPSSFSTLNDDTEERELIESKNEGVNVRSPNVRREGISEVLSHHQGNRVSAIDRIVNFYLGFPANRDALISIDGSQTTYDRLFKEIKAQRKFSKAVNQFFFSKVLITKDKFSSNSFKKHQKKIEIKLFPVDFNEEGERGKHYEIVLEKDNISDRKLTMIESNFNNEFEKGLKTPQANYALYVFFVGDGPKSEDGVTFSLTKNFIYFRYTDIRPTINEI